MWSVKNALFYDFVTFSRYNKGMRQEKTRILTVGGAIDHGKLQTVLAHNPPLLRAIEALDGAVQKRLSTPSQTTVDGNHMSEEYNPADMDVMRAKERLTECFVDASVERAGELAQKITMMLHRGERVELDCVINNADKIASRGAMTPTSTSAVVAGNPPEVPQQRSR